MHYIINNIVHFLINISDSKNIINVVLKFIYAGTKIRL